MQESVSIFYLILEEELQPFLNTALIEYPCDLSLHACPEVITPMGIIIIQIMIINHKQETWVTSLLMN